MESLHVVEQATNDVSAPEPRLEPPWPQLPPAAVEERRERGADHLEARRVHGLLRLATLEGQEDDGRLAFAVVRGRVEELAHAERRADEGQVGVDLGRGNGHRPGDTGVSGGDDHVVGPAQDVGQGPRLQKVLLGPTAP